MYKMQTEGDIFSISENLWNIVQEEKVHHIQVLLADKLNWYKEKGNQYIEEYIKII